MNTKEYTLYRLHGSLEAFRRKIKQAREIAEDEEYYRKDVK